MTGLFISLDTVVYDEHGQAVGTLADRLPEPTSVGEGPAGGREPRNGAARFDYYVALMRAPVRPQAHRKRRSLSARDFIRTGHAQGEVIRCDRCGQDFPRLGRGRRPRFCPACREASRNKAPRNAAA